MRKTFEDSLKALEADIQHANTLAFDYPREYDGACLQMRLSYSPCAHIFSFLFSGVIFTLLVPLDCSEYLFIRYTRMARRQCVFMSRKASIRQFYGVIFPSLLQLQRGITDVEDRKQKELCATKYKRRDEDKGKLAEIEIEREEECGICMEINSKVVLPSCNHSWCLKCYRNWRSRSQSCPFCRNSLKRVNSGDLWIYTSTCDIVDLSSITRESLNRLINYIDKLPVIVSDQMLVS